VSTGWHGTGSDVSQETPQMVQCLVNGESETLEFRPETWGDVLGRLDERLAAERRVVTAVRFDGVDQPTFRHAEQTRAPLGGLARIEVDAEDAARLLAASLDAAADSVPELVAGVRLTAAAMRNGAPDGAMQLSALIAALQSLVSLTAAAATAADLAGSTAPAADAAMAEAGTRLGEALSAVAACQERGDAVALADALDGSLAGVVAGWGDVLEPIRAGVTA
jgi:hypothetical protein